MKMKKKYGKVCFLPGQKIVNVVNVSQSCV